MGDDIKKGIIRVNTEWGDKNKLSPVNKKQPSEEG